MAQELIFTETFKRNYALLPADLQKRFDQKLNLFLENPRHPSLHVHRYHARDDVWEAYINRKYRFTFSVTPVSITFRNIGPHGIIDRGQV